jgi:hypothetical protein
MRKKHALITHSDNRRLRSLLKPKAAHSGANNGRLARLRQLRASLVLDKPEERYLLRQLNIDGCLIEWKT